MSNTANKPQALKAQIREYKKIQISSPSIDKFTFLPLLEDETAFDRAKHALTTQAFEGVLKDTDTTKRDLIVLKMNLQLNERKTTYLQIDISSLYRRIRLEHSPSKIDSSARACLDDIARKAFDLRTFEHLLIGAKVTRVDICRDIHGMHIEDFFFKAKQMRVCNNFKTDHTGVLETINFGTRGSNQFCIYNKAMERGLNPFTSPAWTRIEYRRIPQNFFMSDLLDLKNPFPQLEIYGLDLGVLNFIPQEYLVWFMDSCRFRGVSDALKAGHLQGKVKDKTLRQMKERLLPCWIAAQRNWDSEWIEALKIAHLYDAAMNQVGNGDEDAAH